MELNWKILNLIWIGIELKNPESNLNWNWIELKEMNWSEPCIETIIRKIHKVQKPNISSLWFTDLRIPISTFRNVYVNEADHVTKSDLNSKLKIAATIMT